MMSQKCCFFRFLLQLFNFVFFPDGLQFWKISGWVMGGEDKKTTWQPVTGASYWYRSKTETPKKEERLLKKNQYFEDSFWVLFSSIRFAYRFKEKQISSFQHFSSSEIEESCGSWWDLIMGHVATGCIKNLPLNHVVGRIRVHPHPKKKTGRMEKNGNTSPRWMLKTMIFSDNLTTIFKLLPPLATTPSLWGFCRWRWSLGFFVESEKKNNWLQCCFCWKWWDSFLALFHRKKRYSRVYFECILYISPYRSTKTSTKTTLLPLTRTKHFESPENIARFSGLTTRP